MEFLTGLYLATELFLHTFAATPIGQNHCWPQSDRENVYVLVEEYANNNSLSRARNH